VLPPLQHLNTFLKSGSTAEASWEPFDISVKEYEALVPQLLQPDRVYLERFSQHTWQVFQLDPSLDQYTDYAQWQQKVREKHQQSWGLQMATLQHEMVMSAHKKS